MRAVLSTMFVIVLVAQFILHYVGWLGVVLGVIALLFGNFQRGSELIIGGLGIIVLKYLVGFVFLMLFQLGKQTNR